MDKAYSKRLRRYLSQTDRNLYANKPSKNQGITAVTDRVETTPVGYGISWEQVSKDGEDATPALIPRDARISSDDMIEDRMNGLPCY